MGLGKEHSFSLGIHATVFQAEMCAIKACVMEKYRKGATKVGTSIFFLTAKQQLNPSIISM
jgi:hypothetical protein